MKLFTKMDICDRLREVRDIQSHIASQPHGYQEEKILKKLTVESKELVNSLLA